ncbi:Sodium-dependent dicarboxylate transporter SdcS [Enhygromyxa salina]|uniref:Sodium-dependent dicarboxylate transporter SdcS n=1 Tax=Enhygromyxa salina TaxID=215803 RepID=A0A2S9Y459_9BACT|nr:SLC13 family permease [Enhygromyxa salina]PRP99878.1 Sodium-dependent dicarboxylate transporter SdcS [Enhygromyxa salina]
MLAPLVFIGLLLAPMPGLSAPAQRVLAIAALTAVLWISEVIPLAVSALLAPALAVLLDVAPAKQVFAPFAHPLIFLFIGGFMLAEALSVHGFDRRAALWLLCRPVVRGSPARALVVVALTAFGFSMWINNTATTAMMIPIAVGLCTSIRGLCPTDPELLARQRRYEEGMLITLACAASIGGICTPIGTAANMIALGELDRALGVHLDFLQWMAICVPIAIVALIVMLALACRRWPPALEQVEGLTDSVRGDLAALGPVSDAERRALSVFLLAIAGWLAPSLLRLGLGEGAPATAWARRALPEGVVALLAATLLFVVPASRTARNRQSWAQGRRWTPLMRWADASAIDWGTVLLFGGGLALGGLTVNSGLADVIGARMDGWLGHGAAPLLLLFAIATLVILMTELVSNTATINMLLPVVIPLAVHAGMDPVPVVLTATLAASLAFMLPVSTPPNAIAYGTGLVRIPTMIRFGAQLNLMGLVLLTAVGAWFLPAVRFW